MAVRELVRFGTHAVGLSTDDDDQLKIIFILRRFHFRQTAAHFELVVGDGRERDLTVFVQQIFLEKGIVSVASLLIKKKINRDLTVYFLKV